MILDHSSVVGPYTVDLATTGSVRTLVVGDTLNANQILLQVSGTGVPAIAIAGDGGINPDFVIEQDGRIENTKTSGNLMTTLASPNLTAELRAGSHCLHNSSGSFATPFAAGAYTTDAASTIEFGQSAGTAVAFSGRTDGNLTLSATGAKTHTAAGAGGTTINGTLTVGPNATFNPSMTAAATNFNGDIVLNGGNCTFSNTGGIVFASSTTVSGSASLTLGNATAQTVQINPGGTVTVMTGLTFAANEVVNVNGGGTLVCPATQVGGTGTVTVNPGGTLGILHHLGLATGTGQFSSAGSFSTAGNYTYAGTSPQVTGSSLPATVNDLTNDNSMALTLSGSVNIAGLLSLGVAALIPASNTLELAPGADPIPLTLGYVNGPLTISVNATTTGDHYFPVGTASGKTAVGFTITSAGTGSGTVTITSFDGDHPNAVDPPNCLDRYWTITASGISGYTATLGFVWLAGDVTGGTVEAAMLAGRFAGGTWTILPATISDLTHNGTMTGVTDLPNWTFGNPGSVPVELSVFSTN